MYKSDDQLVKVGAKFRTYFEFLIEIFSVSIVMQLTMHSLAIDFR